MSGSVAPLQLGSVLKSVAHTEARDLESGCHITAEAIQIWVACAATRAMMSSRPRLLPRAMSGSVAL